MVKDFFSLSAFAAAASAAEAAASSQAPAASSPAPGQGKRPSFVGPRLKQLTGTVTAVGTGSVGIKTTTATTTYSITTTSHIEKPGTAKATLTDVKVGDTVFFVTTTTGGTVIADLIDGKLPTVAGFGGHGFGPGGPGGPGGRTGHGPQTPASPSASASTAATNT